MLLQTLLFIYETSKRLESLNVESRFVILSSIEVATKESSMCITCRYCLKFSGKITAPTPPCLCQRKNEKRRTDTCFFDKHKDFLVFTWHYATLWQYFSALVSSFLFKEYKISPFRVNSA